MAKTIDELQNEYMQTAAELGDVAYQLSVIQDRYDELTNKMHNLNKQARKVNDKAASEASEAEKEQNVAPQS